MTQLLKDINDFKNKAVSNVDPVWVYEAGSFIVAYGSHVLTLVTNTTPKKVWILPSEPPGSIPVCAGDVNLVGVEIIKNGFIIFADVKTDKCEIEWYAELI